MTMVSPEGNFSSPGVTLLESTTGPTTSEVIILGEDLVREHASHPTPVDIHDAAFIGPQFPTVHDSDFVGPHDATDYSRGFLLSRAKNLAEVAVMNFGAYEGQRERLMVTTRESVAAGTLRLNSEFKEMTADQQVTAFVVNAVNATLTPREDILSLIESERVQRNLGSRGPERVLQTEVNSLKEVVRKQSGRILKVRTLLVERGATEAFMKEFDYTTKLMTRPEIDAYEVDMQLDPDHEAPLVNTGEIKIMQKFKNILGAAKFSKESLRRVGIRAPQSAEVIVITQQDTTPAK